MFKVKELAYGADTSPDLTSHLKPMNPEKTSNLCLLKSFLSCPLDLAKKIEMMKNLNLQYKQGNQVVATFIELAAWSYFKFLQCSTNHYFVKINVIKSRN